MLKKPLQLARSSEPTDTLTQRRTRSSLRLIGYRHTRRMMLNEETISTMWGGRSTGRGSGRKPFEDRGRRKDRDRRGKIRRADQIELVPARERVGDTPGAQLAPQRSSEHSRPAQYEGLVRILLHRSSWWPVPAT